MHLRRAILLMGLILLVTAIVGALVPGARDSSPVEAPRPAPEGAGAAPVRTISLRYPPAAQAPRLRVDADSHVLLQVITTQPGQVIVGSLDLVASAEPHTPARFDVLAPLPGRYPVAFQPAAGGPARTLGTLTVIGAQ
ncbi:MAG: hypothetical protein ACJ760_10040 [Thermoleophilaceae bacterium]